jgi:hypothetical protein
MPGSRRGSILGRMKVAKLVVVLALGAACATSPVKPPSTPTPPTSATPIAPASPTQPSTASLSPSPTTTATSDGVTIDLAELSGSGVDGSLTATQLENGNTDLRVFVPGLAAATTLYPWSLHPSFNCAGNPAEDSQLPVALPDIEQGVAQEVVPSAGFASAVGVVVFELVTDSATPVACGILPPLPWAPTVAPTPSSGSATPGASPPGAVADLVGAMEAAVLAVDADAYLALVDTTDQVFATEHERWAGDWANVDLREFDLTVSDVSISESNALATGTLTVVWETDDQPLRTAELDVQFTRSGGGWLYAGETWVTEEVEHFRVRVAPGLESEIPAITVDLPYVYEHVTESIGHEPQGVMEIKLYTGAPELVATVQLGLPDIRGWTEPGEALKLRLDPEAPSLTPAIAHEFTHFVEFDRAGTQRSRMPWWLSEGLAVYVAYHFEGEDLGELRLEQVREWAAEGDLVDWSEMSVFEATRQSLWQFVYPQGYAMTRFVTEEYGEELRNDWLAAMATEMDITQATQAELGISFEELAADFEAWLGT